MTTPAFRHFLADDDITPDEQKDILRLGLELKRDPYVKRVFEGPQTVAVMFDKTSTRTRLSFVNGVAALGGYPIVIDSGSSQLGKGETIADTGHVLSRMTSMVIWRTTAHSSLEELAEVATVPIVNGLCDDLHPCQVLADLLTLVEHLCPEEGPEGLAGKKVAYLGDGANNMANSYLLGMATAGMEIVIISPKDFVPKKTYVKRAEAIAKDTGAKITITDDINAVNGAHAVITDTWVSMGQENDGIDRLAVFRDYQVNDEVMAKADPNAVFLHCLPAYRGNEVTAEVIDGKQSVVFDEAENRVHAQKALMVWLMEQQSA